MGDGNLSQKSFIPGASTNWVYLNTLGGYNKELEAKATSLITNTKNKVFSKGEKVRLNTLSTLIKQERKKEEALFKYFNIPYDKDKTADYVRAIHILLQTEDVLEHNIEQVVNDKAHIDVSREFPMIFNRVFSNWLSSNSVDTLTGPELWELVLQAVEEMYSKDLKNGKSNPYLGLWEYLKQQGNKSHIMKTILHWFFGVAYDEIEQLGSLNLKVEDIKKKFGLNSKNQYAVLNKKGKQIGQMVEAQTSALLGKAFSKAPKGVTVRNIHTGGLDNMKADNMIMINVDLPEDVFDLAVGQSDASARVRNIRRMQNLHQSLSQGKRQFIIQVSDKSYSINEDFKNKYGGFTAQGSVSLKNLEKVFNEMGVKIQSSMPQLLFALAHIGENLLTQNDKEAEAEKYLASYIAYFMFDDIGMDEVNNTLDGSFANAAAIHVFNLNGIYIPMSVYLQALYDAISEYDKNSFNNYVRADIKDGNLTSYTTATGSLTREDWETTQKQRYEQDFISFHFLGNFKAFVMKYLR